MKTIAAFIIFSSLFILGCQTNSEQATSTIAKESVPLTDANSSTLVSETAVPFTGKVVYLSFEGGFWGIITDSNQKLDGAIPKAFQVEGLRVKGAYKVLKDVHSFHMWGRVVNFIKLHKE